MPAEAKARRRVIEMISEKLGFPFKEEDLSPKLRSRIGALAAEIDKAWSLESLRSLHKKKVRKLSLWILSFSMLGLIFSLLLVLLLSWGAIVIGFLFWSGAYLAYRKRMKEKEMAERIESEANAIWSRVSKNISQLTESAYSELSALYEARVRPTVRHVTIDFASIIKAARGRGIILDTIVCPYCGAPVNLPKVGESFECKHCGRTIKATDVFDKLKSIISRTV